MFSLYSCEDNIIPWFVFETNDNAFNVSVLSSKRIYCSKKAATKQQLLEKYGHLSFDILYLYGKI